MRKNVLVFGTISGLIVTAFMIYSTAKCYTNADFESSEIIGYSSMIVAFAFIFVGIKNYRDKYNGGAITFGKAFKIGLYITLIAGTFYVVAWLVEYYAFIPDFMEKYTAHVLKEASNDRATAVDLEKKATEMREFSELYKNPLMVVLLTYTEIIPVGLVITLISALILKRKRNPDTTLTA
jgi:hypothetical protein